MASTPTVVLITGANSGIGFETTRLLVQSSRSYQILAGGRSLKKGEEAVAKLAALGGDNPISAIQLDITDQASIVAAVDSVSSMYGRLDVLINNAAIFLGMQKEPLSSQTDAMRKTLDTYVIGTVAATEAFLPLLLKSEDAKIVMLSSSLGSLTMAAEAKPHILDVMAYRCNTL